MSSEELQRVGALLAWARRRADASPRGSPEWAAAIEAVDAAQRELDRLAAEGSLDPSARTSLLHLGPLVLPDGHRVEGVVAGREDRAQDLHREAAELVGHVMTRHEFLHELESLAAQRKFALETQAREWDVVEFYAWDETSSGNEAITGAEG